MKMKQRIIKIIWIEMKKEIKTGKAPQAIGPFSQAIEANGFVFVSGQIALDPKTGELNSGSINLISFLCLRQISHNFPQFPSTDILE